MNFFALFLVSYPIIIALCAPTASIDAEALRQNALDAQVLNAEFQGLHETDSCDSGQMACIRGAFAQCVFGVWQLQPCKASQQCFALPSVNNSGTILTCTSQASALSIMTAAGATGGLMSNCTNTTVAFPTQSIPTTPTASANASIISSSATSTTDDVEVVTVTVTLPLTLPPSTTTLQPQEAFSILASLSAEGFLVSALPFSISSTTPNSTLIVPSGSPTASPDAPCTMTSHTDEPTASSSDSGVPLASPYRRTIRDRRRAIIS